MAKATVNKSAAIREYYTGHPRAKPKQVVAALGEQGIDVSAQTVSTIRYAMRLKKGRGRKRRGASQTTARAGRPAANGRGAKLFESLIEAKKLSDRLGGVRRAREALRLLEKLV